ncbi:MAG: HEAT repeat domain-containing protein [Cyanobacteria bacterium J06634_5]
MTDWSHYLASVCKEYAHWWEKYTLTDVTGKAQQTASKGGGLLLDLMAETVPEKDEGDPQKGKQADKIERFTVLEGLRKYAKEHVLLQGAPGSGKSTAMARLLLEEAGRAQDSAAPGKAAVEQKAPKIPVLVELRYYAKSLRQLIEDSLQRNDPLLDVGELEQWLSEGRLLLLLDGINELPSKSARQDMRRFRRRYEKTTPMVFTTRKLGEGGDLGIGKKLTMQPLSEAQMQDFVQAYLPGQGKAMLAQLGDRLQEFGAVPLLLLMLCSVYASNQQQIPTNLGGIFRQFTQQYDNKIQQDVPDTNKSKLLWPEMLEELAFRMMVGSGTTEALVAISQADAVDIIRNFCQDAGEQGSLAQAKLWVEDLLKYHLIQLGTADSIQFRHQLIQEYYAAEKLMRQLPKLSDKNLKWQYLNYFKWTEPLALMAGLVNEKTQALRLVRLALEIDYDLGARLAGTISERWQPQAIKFISDLKTFPLLKTSLLKKTHSASAMPGLLLAMKSDSWSVRHCAAEALGEIGDTTAVSRLLSGLEDDNWEVRRSAAVALGKIGDATAVSGLLTLTLRDDWLAVRSTAAKSLSKINSATAVSGLFRALGEDNRAVSRRAADALGEIGTAAVPGLISAFENSDRGVRCYLAYVLGQIGNATAVPGLMSVLKDNDLDVCLSAAEALIEIGDVAAMSELLSELLNALRNDDVDVHMRYDAAKVLSKIDNAAVVSGLLSALRDENQVVRHPVVVALGDIGDAAAVPGLLRALGDDDRIVRRNTAKALGKIGDNAAVSELLTALKNDSCSGVRFYSAEALGRIGNPAAVLGLISALRDGDSKVRHKAVKALIKIGGATAVSGLLSALENGSWDVRIDAAKALGEIADATAVSGLLSALENGSWDVRMSAAEALGEIADATAVQGLLDALRDDDFTIRRPAAKALGKISDKRAISELLNALRNDDDWDVRSLAALALGEIGDTSAVPELLKSLKDENVTVRGRAASALGEIGDTSAVSKLLDSLDDDDWYVHGLAIAALGKIRGESTMSGLIKKLEDQSLDTLDEFNTLKQVQGSLSYYRPFPSTSMKTREVFISYAWNGESETIADQLNKAFQSQNINIIRDKKDVGYKANIRDFMQQIGQGKCVLVVISDKYLKSENCMFELVEIANNGDFYDRIFPIVLSDANIYKATARLKYIQYWEQQIKDLETDMKAGGLANLQGITDDLNLYTKIRNNIASLTDTLKNMNTLTPDMHRDSNFEAVIDAVQDKLVE